MSAIDTELGFDLSLAKTFGKPTEEWNKVFKNNSRASSLPRQWGRGQRKTAVFPVYWLWFGVKTQTLSLILFSSFSILHVHLVERWTYRFNEAWNYYKNDTTLGSRC